MLDGVVRATLRELGTIYLPAPLGGWVWHFIIGTFWWGAMFAILEPILPGQRPWRKGMAFGFGASLLIFLLVMPVAGAGYFVGGKLTGASDGETQKAEHKEDGKSKGGQHAETIPSEMYLMEDIIVNPSGTGGTRFLSASIGIEVTSKHTVELIEKREPIIKDALITILGSKTIEQLSDTKEKEITRYQIKKRLEQLLKAEDIMAVYFTDFILQ